MSDKDLPHEPPSADDESASEEREASFSRRALIHAGWSVPVVMAVQPPKVFAISPHIDAGGHGDVITPIHTDSAHTDTLTHTDVHGDVPGPPHTDFQPHLDALIHFDVVSHSDVVVPSHTDT